MPTSATTLAGLLKTGDGQCGAWANLLYSAVKAQGLPSAGADGIGTVKQVTIRANLFPKRPVLAGQLGFLVTPWKFGAKNNMNAQTKALYPWVNEVNSVFTVGGISYPGVILRPQGYDFKGVPAVSYGGVNGGAVLLAQNNSNPFATFENHVVVKIDGKYYDPSYGAIYASLADMQNSAIAGFYNIPLLAGKTMLIAERTRATPLLLWEK